MAHLRYEAWPFPGSGSYDVVVRDLQAITGSGSRPKKPIGYGSVDIPRNTVRVDGSKVLDAVVFADPVTPANDVTSLIRVYRPGDAEDSPVHEWLTEDPVAEADGAGNVRLSGRNIEAVLDYEFVEVWDWEESAVFQSLFPDHIYGGRDVVRNGGLEDPQIVNEVYELWNDQIGASTWTATLESDTTAAIAFDATAAQVEAAIELTTGISNCLVTGAGTEADPWLLEFVDPAIIDPDMFVTDGGGLTSTLSRTVEGRLSTAPFTISRTIAQGVNWVHGALDPGHPFLSTAVVRTGTYSLAFNGVDQFAGVQQVVRVKPGGLYQASMWANTADTAALWRLVIRTPLEEFVGSSTPFSGTTLAASTWTEFTIADVVIPDGITEVVMRFAYVGTGDPGQVYTDDWSLTEGQATGTPGDYLHDLFDDAQTDHAPTRAALTYINLDFTTTLDSGGNAWTDSALPMTFKRRQSYLHVMRQFEKLGYQWRLVPTAGTPGEWDLQVYNPGTMGTDHGGVDDPAIVVGQGTLPSNVTRQRPVANYVMAEGAEGFTSRIFSTTSIAATGRRAQAVGDRRFTDSGALTTWATQRLNDYLAETLAPRVTIAEPNTADDWPRPLDEYVPADIVDFILADGSTRVERVIESVTYSDDGQNALRWVVEGGSAAPYIGPAAYSGGDDHTGGGGGEYIVPPQATGGVQASALRVIGNAVKEILEEFRFSEDPEHAALPTTRGSGVPAFTIRLAMDTARAETQAAADLICLSGDDHSVQIRQAIDVCDALGFGKVICSEGTYTPGSDFTVPSRVHIEGMGRDVTYWFIEESITITIDQNGGIRQLGMFAVGGG